MKTDWIGHICALDSFLFHMNELPLQHMFAYIDGTTSILTDIF